MLSWWCTQRKNAEIVVLKPEKRVKRTEQVLKRAKRGRVADGTEARARVLDGLVPNIIEIGSNAPIKQLGGI